MQVRKRVQPPLVVHQTVSPRERVGSGDPDVTRHIIVHIEGLHEIFKYAHLKFTVYGRKRIHYTTSANAVGLAQARPKLNVRGG